MMATMSFDIIVAQPTHCYLAPDANAFAKVREDLRAEEHRWVYMQEAGLTWNGVEIPYLLTVEDGANSVVFGSPALANLEDSVLQELAGHAIDFLMKNLSKEEAKGGHHG